MGSTPIPIRILEQTDSTNAEARRLAEAGDSGPLWIAARDQTHGRGRQGRTWFGGPGDLAATLLLTLDKPPGEAALIAFVAALALADLAELYAPAEAVRLKWPNDLLLDGRKAAGVLVESGGEGRRRWLAVGVGVNLTAGPEGLDQPATGLGAFASGQPPSPDKALIQLSAAFQHWLDIWITQGFEPIRKAWTERAFGLGQACVARLPSENLKGVAEALDADGALRLRLGDGSLRRVTAGDVFFGAD